MYFIFGSFYSNIDIAIIIVAIIFATLGIISFVKIAPCEESPEIAFFLIFFFITFFITIGIIDGFRNLEKETHLLARAIHTKQEKDIERIYKLKDVIKLVKNHHHKNLENLRKAKKDFRSRNRVIRGWPRQSDYVFYTEASKLSAERLIDLAFEHNKLQLRYNGFLVGDPIFEKLCINIKKPKVI